MNPVSPWGLATRGARLPGEATAAVLIVDDDANKRLAMRAVLEQLHLDIVEADSGLGALRRVMERDFAVILLDVRMPDIDGFETAALIRRRRESEMTPIIFITAFTSDEIGTKARYVSGAVDFMPPPVSPDELRAKVSVFVSLFLHAQRLATEARNVQESADRLGVLTDAAPIGIFHTDKDNRFTYTNPRWSEISGISAARAFGNSWDTLLTSDKPHGSLLESSEEVSPGEIGSRYRIWLSDSESRVVLVAAEPLTAPGEVTGWVGTLSDVTADADAELERARFRSLVQNSRHVIAILDASGTCTYSSPGILEVTGYTAEECIGVSGFDFIHPDDVSIMTDELDEILLTPSALKTVELRFNKKDGSWIWVEVRATNHLDDPSIQGIVLNYHDISVRRKAEVESGLMAEELRHRERLFRGAFDASHTGIALTASDGEKYVDVNQALCTMLGYTKEELLELNWKVITHPDDLERSVEEFGQLLHGQKDIDAVKKRYVTKDGRTLWIEINDAVVRGPDGVPLYFVTHINNVTELHDSLHEKQGLETQLVQSQKMEAIGQLAGGIAHDFNNILSVILNYAQFASHDLEPGDPRLADIQEITKAGDKAARLVHQLLAFSRKEIVEQRDIDLNEVVTGIFSILGRALGEDIKLEFRHEDDLPPVLADAGRIEQVLLNLAVNARDAMPDGGALEITTSTVSVEHDEMTLLPAGLYVLTTICDSGTGIDEATLARIFEPFFTTKPRGEGTGMGLSSAYGIIEQAGGSLRVTSEVGKGTTFSIYLPARDGRLGTESKPLPAIDIVPPTDGIETILLVEDEDAVRKLVARILREQGYEVIPCSSGDQALDYFKMNASTVDLLLTDVVMPKMSGKELSDKATAISSDLKTLFMSGYTDALIEQRGVLAADQDLLSKPFDPDSLITRVRSMFSPATAA